MRKPDLPKTAAALVALVVLALPDASLAGPSATRDFEKWFGRYKARRIDLYRAVESGYAVRTDEGGVRVEYYQSDGLRELDRLLEGMKAEGGERAARLLLDAAVHALDRDPDDERRRFVAQQPWIVRRRAAETLGALEGDDVRDHLRRTALRDRSPLDGEARRRVAVEALGTMRDVASVEALARRLAEDEATSVRSAAAAALGKVGGAPARSALEAALSDPEPTVRLEALLALDRRADEAADDESAAAARLAAARTLLADPAWSVRLAAARLLGDHRDPESVPALLAALLREVPLEEGTRRRVRAAIRDALGRLTGEDFPASRPDEWVAWWSEHAPTFALEEAGDLPAIAPEQGARFFGIPVEADEVVFLVDVSGSMERSATGAPSGPSRLFVATRELRRCLESLEDGTRFNVILFHERIVPFRTEPVEKTAESVAAARAFVEGAEPRGGTNLFGALEFVLGRDDERTSRLIGRDLDTVVLLTDGKPSRGPILVPDEILHQVEERNRGRRIAIHTVTAGVSDPFLESLARRNFGEHASLGD